MHCLQQLRTALQDSPVRFQGRAIPVTFSAEDLIALADRRLSSAKRQGRDRIAAVAVIAPI